MNPITAQHIRRHGHLTDAVIDTVDRRALMAAVEAVTALHFPVADPPGCYGCAMRWPCPTTTRIAEAVGAMAVLP